LTVKKRSAFLVKAINKKALQGGKELGDQDEAGAERGRGGKYAFI